MIPLIMLTDWYRIITNPTADDAFRIGLIFSLLIFCFLMALLSDKIDELNDKKRMKKISFISPQKNNEFMFLTGDHK